MTPPVPNPARSLRSFLLALAAHLDTHNQLPEPATVTLTRLRNGLDCQPQHRDPTDLAAELLAWADTLRDTSIELRRLDAGPVHLHVTGLLPEGHRITLYATAPTSLISDYLDPIVPHRRALLAPAALRAWAIAETGDIA